MTSYCAGRDDCLADAGLELFEYSTANHTNPMSESKCRRAMSPAATIVVRVVIVGDETRQARSVQLMDGMDDLGVYYSPQCGLWTGLKMARSLHSRR